MKFIRNIHRKNCQRQGSHQGIAATEGTAHVVIDEFDYPLYEILQASGHACGCDFAGAAEKEQKEHARQ
jgi:hypothetical protein